jgi:hypothetical protein
LYVSLVRCDTSSRDVLGWCRRRQCRVTRWVLALFCLAWVQLALVPCASALVPVDAHAAKARAVQRGGAASSGLAAHSPCTTQAHAPAVESGSHCPYCPGKDAAGTTRGACSYRLDPQLDGRQATLLTALLPPVPVVFLFELRPARPIVPVAAYESSPVPGASIAVRYSRFLE